MGCEGEADHASQHGCESGRRRDLPEFPPQIMRLKRCPYGGRRAVNCAIDRPTLAAQGQRFAEVTPFNAGSPAPSADTLRSHFVI